MSRRRRLAAAATLAVAVLLPAAPATAADERVAASGGVAELESARDATVALRGGRVHRVRGATLVPVAGFGERLDDVGLGVDERGRPTLVTTRCEPEPAGCTLAVRRLDGGRARRVRAPDPGRCRQLAGTVSGERIYTVVVSRPGEERACQEGIYARTRAWGRPRRVWRVYSNDAADSTTAADLELTRDRFVLLLEDAAPDGLDGACRAEATTLLVRARRGARDVVRFRTGRETCRAPYASGGERLGEAEAHGDSLYAGWSCEPYARPSAAPVHEVLRIPLDGAPVRRLAAPPGGLGPFDGTAASMGRTGDLLLGGPSALVRRPAADLRWRGFRAPAGC